VHTVIKIPIAITTQSLGCISQTTEICKQLRR